MRLITTQLARFVGATTFSMMAFASTATASTIDFEDLQLGSRFCSTCVGVPQGERDPSLVFFDDVGIIHTNRTYLLVGSYSGLPTPIPGGGGGGGGSYRPIDAVTVSQNIAGGESNKFVQLDNASLTFHVAGGEANGMTFDIDSEESVEMKINGESVTVSHFNELNGMTVGGVEIFYPIPFFLDDSYTFTRVHLHGVINSITIGGADLSLDNVNLGTEVPEPTTIVLLGTALLGLARKRAG